MHLLLLASAHAATLKVGPSETYTTIGDALAVASAGDTISVYPGTYAEDLDLRGLDVDLVTTGGPSRTFLAPSAPVYIDSGLLEGLSIATSSTYGVVITEGDPTLRNLVIEGAGSYGVYVTTGTALIEDVVVRDAGLHAFIAKAGTPTFRHDVAWYPGTSGFAMQTDAIVTNCISIGGPYGFKTEGSAATFNHLLTIGQTTAATAASVDMGVANSVLYEGALAVKCSSGIVANFPNGLAYPTLSYSGCATGTTLAMDIADPAFALYDASYELQFIDLGPGGSSPMVDAGDDLDSDGSVGDLGPFGGPEGEWSDRDGDGWPDVFDCDDHNADTYAYATEIGDGEDNDCDGTIDEDVPVDTGDTGTVDTGDTGTIDTGDTGTIDTGDTGDTGTVDTSDTSDTGTIDTGDTGTIDTGDTGDTGTIDTGDTGDTGDTEIIDTMDSLPETGDTEDTSVEDPGNEDLDGDGYTAAVDCDEHNLMTWPGAEEIPDHADNDCDGLFDEGTALGDWDGDGYTLGGGDCNDVDATVHPDLVEPAGSDGLDQNCDGVDDDGREEVDSDADGYAEDVDCDDWDAEVHPGAHEDDDLFDNDCDGRADEDTIDADRDSDGVTPTEGDCNDHNSGYGPNVSDTPDNFLDEDCTGTDNYDVDRDGDPSPTSGGTDCDDTRSTVHPGADEYCGDGVDNNCDTLVDDNCGGPDTGGGKNGDDCGCAAGSNPGSALVLVGVAALLRRRRVSLRVSRS